MGTSGSWNLSHIRRYPLFEDDRNGSFTVRIWKGEILLSICQFLVMLRVGGMPLGRTFQGKVTRIVFLKERKTKKALQNYPT